MCILLQGDLFLAPSSCSTRAGYDKEAPEGVTKKLLREGKLKVNRELLLLL